MCTVVNTSITCELAKQKIKTNRRVCFFFVYAIFVFAVRAYFALYLVSNKLVILASLPNNHNHIIHHRAIAVNKQ